MSKSDTFGFPCLAEIPVELDDASIVSPAEAKGDNQNKEIVIRKQQQQLRQEREEHFLRKKYLRKVYRFVRGVVIFSFTVVAVSATGLPHLSDAVLITLLTSTIANVLGCLFIAFHWLFPSREGIAAKKQ